jgi:hypothetical protein
MPAIKTRSPSNPMPSSWLLSWVRQVLRTPAVVRYERRPTHQSQALGSPSFRRPTFSQLQPEIARKISKLVVSVAPMSLSLLCDELGGKYLGFLTGSIGQFTIGAVFFESRYLTKSLSSTVNASPWRTIFPARMCLVRIKGSFYFRMRFLPDSDLIRTLCTRSI